MTDHITIRVKDFNKSMMFYLKALKPIGCTLVAEYNPGEVNIQISNEFLKTVRKLGEYRGKEALFRQLGCSSHS